MLTHVAGLPPTTKRKVTLKRSKWLRCRSFPAQYRGRVEMVPCGRRRRFCRSYPWPGRERVAVFPATLKNIAIRLHEVFQFGGVGVGWGGAEQEMG